MEFLRNYWYCAAWEDEVSRTPMQRTLLGEKIVLYRKEAAGIVAMGNVCSHRFALLHEGKLHGDVLSCPYHGLQFGEGGVCVHNPHGKTTARLNVKGYPVVERYGVAWIWMGAPELADESRIPRFDEHSDPSFRSVFGHIHVKGSYELVSDNLLDLSHTQYLHSFLTHEENPESRVEFRIEQDGDTLTTIDDRLNIAKAGFVDFAWPDGPDRIDSRSGVRWQPPANMRLKVHLSAVGRSAEENGRIAWGAELVTPETATTCHYFWSFARSFRTGERELDDVLRQTIGQIFMNEDAVVIEKIQANMGHETDLLSLKPAILPTDRAAVMARRIVQRLLDEESLGASSSKER